MTQDQFIRACKQLNALSMAAHHREVYMNQALAHYGARQYEWAMFYNFLFLQWQDEVERLKGAATNGDAHRLWYLIGGQP